MKKIIKNLGSVLMTGVLLTSVQIAIAADANPPTQLQIPRSPLPNGGKDILLIFSIIANWIFSILLIVAVIYILLAAFNYMTSAGNSEKLTKANKMIIYALVAVAVGLLAKGIITVVSMLTTGTAIEVEIQ